MKRKFLPILVLVVLLAAFACAGETPWRKAAVSTYELVGIGLGSTKDTGEALGAQGLIPPDQLARVKVAYNKARLVYIQAGDTLKLASATSNAIEQGKLLDNYISLLSEFKTLALDVYNLIKNFKKVSYLEVEDIIRTGGEI
jgi:hypothetical protein